MINEYAALSTRMGFNRSLSHFRMVTSLVGQLSQGSHLAELVDELEKDKGINKAQIGPILNAVIVEREGFAFSSFNLPVDINHFSAIQEEVAKWNRVDVIIAYHHPQLGITLINPKQKNHWEAIQDLSRNELAVIYVKGLRDKDKEVEQPVLSAMRKLLEGKQPGATTAFNDPAAARPKAAAPAAAAAPAPAAAPTAQARPLGGGPVSARPQSPPPAAGAAAAPAASAPAAQASGGKSRMTPKYSIQVTNELFHNGNVEAWKNIVESYKTKFPGMEVHIFHDGEKVNDINSLFKWGKVKHGDVLLFSVSGENIQGVAKLQRYLFEGASPRFHNFLKKDVNKVLSLF